VQPPATKNSIPNHKETRPGCLALGRVDKGIQHPCQRLCAVKRADTVDQTLTCAKLRCAGASVGLAQVRVQRGERVLEILKLEGFTCTPLMEPPRDWPSWNWSSWPQS
jgi:hypothetical protein